MSLRSVGLAVFGLFVAISAAYVAFQLIAATPLGIYGAAPIAGVIFGATAIMLDRAFRAL